MAVPVRACDVGGWTDTWFAGTGRVCSLALGPGVTVRAEPTGDGRVEVHLPDLGDRFHLDDVPDRHRLVAESVHEADPADGLGVRLTVSAAVPPATSLGTSGAVCVGVIAAVDALVRGEIRPPGALAEAAHRVEVQRLGRQSGVQDQFAAAHGGANVVDVDYPSATVTPVVLDPAVREALDDRLLHVAYGGPHDSSAVHEQVIAELEREGTGARRLERLRELAGEAASALAAGDLARWGAALTAATETQRSLHAALVSGGAQALIELARSAGALGWKVNGAGGAGGSLSVLCADGDQRRRLAEAVRPLGQPLELRIADRGAHVVGA